MQDERFALSGELLSDCCLPPPPYTLKKIQGDHRVIERITLQICSRINTFGCVVVGVLFVCLCYCCWLVGCFLPISVLLHISLNKMKISSSFDFRSKIILAPFSSAIITHIFLGSPEFLMYPLVYISSSDQLSPEVNKVQLQKVQKNLSFSLQVSSCFSSFILSPWPHCQFSCILHGPTSSSSSWHCSAVSQLALTLRLLPAPIPDAPGHPIPRCTLQKVPCAVEKRWAAGDCHTTGPCVVLMVLPNS